MWFLARMVFWFGATVLLLSRFSSLQIRSTPEAVISDGLTAAIAAISDMRQFCSAQPSTCEAGSQAIVEFGRETQLRAKAVVRILNKEVSIGPTTSATLTRPSQNTLLPADVKAPWREPHTPGPDSADRTTP
jgi:hypothetical protein